MDPTFTERQSALLRLYRHESRQTARAVASSISSVENILKSDSATDHRAEILKRLNQCRILLDELDGKLDVEKIIADMNQKEQC